MPLNASHDGPMLLFNHSLIRMRLPQEAYPHE